MNLRSLHTTLFSTSILALALLSGCKEPYNKEVPKSEIQSSSQTISSTTAPQASTPSATPATDNGTQPTTAKAEISALQGSNVKGTVTFISEGNRMHVVADITGLTPGDHGFHIHEKGDCSAPDGTSAGPHFNPEGATHGGPDSPHHHAGDLGNIVADAEGKAHVDVMVDGLSFDGASSILNRSVVVHEKKDDLKSQPAGDSGKRIGCGVIQK
jgi:Cu-Zn family superoxide dismutase